MLYLYFSLSVGSCIIDILQICLLILILRNIKVWNLHFHHPQKDCTLPFYCTAKQITVCDKFLIHDITVFYVFLRNTDAQKCFCWLLGNLFLWYRFRNLSLSFVQSLIIFEIFLFIMALLFSLTFFNFSEALYQ